MLGQRALDELQRTERALAEVTVAVVGALRRAHVGEAPALGHHVARLDLAREEPAGERVVDDHVEPVAAAGDEQLGLDVAGDDVVHGLVDGRPHPAVVLACHDDLGHLERREVAEPEANKLARAVQPVHGLERLLEGRGAVGAVEVEELCLLVNDSGGWRG